MSWIKTVAREVFGLFVDDGNFAIVILVWLAIVGLVRPHLAITSAWIGIIFFVGLALILLESATRRARHG